MALASRRMNARLTSPVLRAAIGRRLAEGGGLLLACGGIALLAALGSYNPHDPSVNTSSSVPPTNLLGQVGASIADGLLQSFGLAGLLPAFAMLAWAWRIGTRRGLGRFSTRVLCTLLALLPLSALLSAFPSGEHPWPVMAGAGGALGTILANDTTHFVGGLLGPIGLVVAIVLGIALLGLLIYLGFGLSVQEWRKASNTLGHGATRGAVGLARFANDQRERASGWLEMLQTHQSHHLNDDHTDGTADLHGASLASARISVPRAENLEPPFVPDGISGDPRTETRIEPRMEKRPDARNDAKTEPRSGALAAASRIMPPVLRVTRADTPPPVSEGAWKYPSLDLLKQAPARVHGGPSSDALQANARLLETVLDDYGVQGTIRDIRPGPVVTLYELEPAAGIRSSRVIGLADDIARSLSVIAVRIATVPGRNVIGIEVPNSSRETVFLSELLDSAAWADTGSKLALALGKDIGGAPVIADLARMPHLLIAGTTGSGKSVGVNAMILSLLYKHSPDECRLIMIDPKMLELSVYDGIPHLMAPVVTDPKKAISALKWTVREMERRYRAMSQLGVRNIGGYNERVAESQARGEAVMRRVQTGFDEETHRPIFEEQPLALEKLPFIVVVIDEVADLMMVAGKEIEAAVQRLAQMARAAGIHVIMATQRPSVDVITGTIKANFPTRISFQVISKFDSRTILGEQGAEQLLGQGDMLYMAGGSRITRVHGPFVADREVEEIVTFLRAQGEPAYIEEVTDSLDDDSAPSSRGSEDSGDSGQALFDQAVDLVAREGKASTSFIQRHLSIGYNRAAKLIEQMEKEGIVGPANHVGKREILVRRVQNEL